MYLNARTPTTLHAAFSSLHHTRAQRMRQAYVMVALVSVLTVMWCRVVHDAYAPASEQLAVNVFEFSGAESLTSFAFPNVRADLWAAHPHLVAIGIPMGNDAKALAIHEFHKETWGSFPDSCPPRERLRGTGYSHPPGWNGPDERTVLGSRC